MQKKVWVAALAVTVLLGGCGSTTSSSSSQAPDKAQTSSRSAGKKQAKVESTTPSASAKSSSSSSSAQASSTKKVDKSVWNTTKRAELAKFMRSWQSQMGQTYQGTYTGAKPEHLGVVFPDAIKNNDVQFSWIKQSVDLTWSDNGENGSAYQVLEVATGGESTAQWPTTYLFCLHNGQPVVFMTRTTNGGVLYLQDTQNSALQSGFAGIVTGTKPAVLMDASLNADVATAIQNKQWPKAYQGTWYRMDPKATDRKVSRTVNDKPNMWKFHYAYSMTPKWLNVMGADQSVGVGEYMYVRYRYYDGKQIPVLMSGFGVKAWFDHNAYRSAAIAEHLQDTKYGDESMTSDEDVD